MADEWWDKKGAFRALHEMNPVRAAYVLNHAKRHLHPQRQGIAATAGAWDQGLQVLDVGCGGGLLAEALADALPNATLTALDASPVNIGVAAAHQSRRAEQLSHLTYRHTFAETLVEEGRKFDVVCSLEVIEHVNDPAAFVKALTSLVKPGGCLFLSTINRSVQGLLLDIIIPEYILNWIPHGTHEFHKFITPPELNELVAAAGAEPRDQCGMVFNPLSFSWTLDSHNTEANYIMFAVVPLAPASTDEAASP